MASTRSDGAASDAAIQKQLLALIQNKGNAQKALQLLMQSAVVEDQRSPSSASEKATAVLRVAVGLPTSRKPTTKKRGDAKKTKDSEKQWALVGAKLAQSIIKQYTGANDSDDKADAAAALKLAALALSISCQYEPLARLGDLVVDNMLYQVAKKMTEIDECKPSAICVFAAIHLRVWHQHADVSAKLNQKTPAESSPLQQKIDELLNSPTTCLQPADLADICTFPAPQTFHTLQFTRFLSGLVNVAVNVLLAEGENEGILRATTAFEPWISHLSRIPGADAKLPVSLSDRFFRVLWKCAATVDAEQTSGNAKPVDRSLDYRSTALSYMLKCPSYSSAYFFQQIHRVGIQYEKKHAKDSDDYGRLYEFYLGAGNRLMSIRASTGDVNKADSLQWEFVHWLEHYESICGDNNACGALLVAQLTRDYLVQFQPLGPVLGGCVKTLSGSIALERRAAGSLLPTKEALERLFTNNSFYATIKLQDRDAIAAALTADTTNHWTTVIEAFLTGLRESSDHLQKTKGLALTETSLNFLVRCLRKASARLYNTAANADQLSADLAKLVVSSLTRIGYFLSVLRTDQLPPSVASSLVEAIVGVEGRCRRFAVVLSSKRTMNSSDNVSTWLTTAKKNVQQFQSMLSNLVTTTSKPISTSFQLVVGDLHAIARELYGCAARFYKAKQYELVVLSLESVFDLAESYLGHLMRENMTTPVPDALDAAHRNLKVDAVASLLAFGMQQIGDNVGSTKLLGASILYSSDLQQVASTGSVSKYVCALVDGFDPNADTKESVARMVSELCEKISASWRHRGATRDQLVSLFRQFCDELDRAATRVLDQARHSTDDVQHDWQHNMIDACGLIETEMWQRCITLQGITQGARTLEIVKALIQRKCAFARYYTSRNAVEAAECLRSAMCRLTCSLQVVSGKPSTDIGGCYGWRGVIALEIRQLMAHATERSSTYSQQTEQLEVQALEDIKRCIACWSEDAYHSAADSLASGLFDATRIVVCLDSVSYALSLLSYKELESQARDLLSKVRSMAGTVDERAVATGVPSYMFQPGYVIDASSKSSTNDRVGSPVDGVPLASGDVRLELIDAEIGLMLSSVHSDDLHQAERHQRAAKEMLTKFRAAMRTSPEDSQMYRAVAMRELALYVATSELVARDGDLKQAISAAKAALSVCWKLSKKVGLTDAEATRLELPDQIKVILGDQSPDSKTTAYGRLNMHAIECWSWDILLAAKLILSRIASLYAFLNEPHRSAVYYAEAMALLGGVVPLNTQRRPYLDFAQLQILAEKGSQASAIHELISLTTDSSGTDLDESLLAQYCEIYTQRGDLSMLEGEFEQAITSYREALRLLESAEKCSVSMSTASCGCYRRLAEAQMRLCSESLTETSVNQLLTTLKSLKRNLKRCADPPEYALGTCKLVQASVLLLRSSSSKAFLPVDKLDTLMDEVFSTCDHLGISYISQEVRWTLGLVKLVAAETQGSGGGGWYAAGLLSSSNIVELAGAQDPNSEFCIESSQRYASAKQLVSTLTTGIQELPKNWLIVSVSVGTSSDMTLSVIPTDGTDPVSFWLSKTQWPHITDNLANIIESSRMTLSGETTKDAQQWTSEQKKAWWNTRKELDDKLEGVVLKMQSMLGFWRSLLTYRPEPSTQKHLIEQVSDIIHREAETSKKTLSRRSRWIIGAVGASKDVLTDEEISQCFDVVAVEEELSIKEETVKRLLKSVRDADLPSKNDPGSVILILHHRLERFPWEALDVFRGRPVSRMPSMELVLKNFKLYEERSCPTEVAIDPSRVTYLLNPAGDLSSTQKCLEPCFQRGETEQGWRGVVNSVPDEDTIRAFLTEADLFIYCGHGSGEKYLHRDKIAALRGSPCAAALLFGCSSGRVERDGVFGPHGAVLAYLRAGSPAVLAMLWDVTDKDIDLVSKDIVEGWLLKQDGYPGDFPLALALDRARQLCKLKYLNGFAAVCYGLPLHAVPQVRNKSRESKRRRLR